MNIVVLPLSAAGSVGHNNWLSFSRSYPKLEHQCNHQSDPCAPQNMASRCPFYLKKETFQTVVRFLFCKVHSGRGTSEGEQEITRAPRGHRCVKLPIGQAEGFTQGDGMNIPFL